MFDLEFYPTPSNIINLMLEGYNFDNKVILEPSAGKGDIVEALKNEGAKDVLVCERNLDLSKIVSTKGHFLKHDFFEVTSEEISHVNYIVMNPPFSNASKHILHAFNIAPPNCVIIALFNTETLKNAYSQERREFKTLIESFGNVTDLQDCFKESERKTGVNVSMVKLAKGGATYETEFDGFFLEDEPEGQENGIMQYDFIRDIVNRYVAAVKIFDKQLSAGVEMHNLTASFYHSSLSFDVSKDESPIKRAEFKKDLQKNAWKFIFNKMNLTKVVTRGVRENINKFVEQQQNIPFTMRNIYRMLEIVVGTREQTFDKAILEVFDRVTQHHHENRHNVKGWKTNAHFLVGKKFILPYMISPAKEYGYTSNVYTSLRDSYDGIIPDFEKALCFVTGEQYEQYDYNENTGKRENSGILTVNSSISRNSYGEWYESHFFKYKGYKNGNMHFEFKNLDVWGTFNQRVAKLKGFPLFEAKKQTEYQKRNTGRDSKIMNDYDSPQQEAKVLFTFKKQA